MTARGLGDVRAVVAVAIGALGSVWILGLPFDTSGLTRMPVEAPGEALPVEQALTVAPWIEDRPYPGRYRPTPVEERGVAFHASSLGGGFAVQGDHGGRLLRVGHELQVVLSPALVRPMAPYVAGERLTGIRLALAEDSESGWNIAKRGPLVPIGAALEPGEDIWLSGLELTLPDVSEEDLLGRWLVVEHELESWDETGSHKSWTYAHADRETLARLMGWLEDGC